jgi:hypothetical protein
MMYTLERAKELLQDVRRQLAHLERRAGSQRERLEQLEHDYREAQGAHSAALTAKSGVLGKFGAGTASQAEVDAARRLVDEAAARLAQKSELLSAVEADVESVNRQTQQIQNDIAPVTARAWRALFEHLAANRPPEVDAYLARLWAAAKAANGHADFGGILGAVHASYDFTSNEKAMQERLGKEFLQS